MRSTVHTSRARAWLRGLRLNAGWPAIIRLGLVQAALGGIVVLSTSTLNRVMVIELAWAAAIPGALVGLHYAVQLMRPRMGHGTDVSGRCTPWILGGVAVLGISSTLAAAAIGIAANAPVVGFAVALLAFVGIGLGVGAGGTSLLVLLARVAGPARRPAAASIVWITMIVGFVLTTALVGQWLEPYSHARLLAVVGAVSAIAWTVAAFALAGVETESLRGQPPAPAVPVIGDARPAATTPASAGGFREAFKEVWSESVTRRFTFFVFLSMLAYSAQDLILEPFAGMLFSMTPGETTSLSSLQHAGVLLGMIGVALAGSRANLDRERSSWRWTIFGCVGSCLALAGLATAAWVGPTWPIAANVFLLGLANGIYAVSAIAAMMRLLGSGRREREGVRMGTWGAAQALAFGLGGFCGALASDIARDLLDSPIQGWGVVFAAEALLFLVSGLMAWRLAKPVRDARIAGLAINPSIHTRGA